MDQVREIIKSIMPLSGHAMEQIIDITETMDVAAGGCFIQKGSRNRTEYFVIEGICRSFLLNPEGEEITISFYKPGTVLSPHVTRTLNNVSTLNVEALTDLKLGKMDASEFESLMVDNLEIREFGNSVLKMELQKKVGKEIQMASLTAGERLLRFRKDYPGFENLVPHATIATFLGITNVSLSRLRKNLAGN